MNEISSFFFSFCSFRHKYFSSSASNNDLQSCSQSVHLEISCTFPSRPGEICHNIHDWHCRDSVESSLRVNAWSSGLCSHCNPVFYSAPTNSVCHCNLASLSFPQSRPPCFWKSITPVCLNDSRNFQIWIAHEMTSLRASKNICFQLIDGHIKKYGHIYLKLTPSCPEPVRNASWYPVS